MYSEENYRIAEKHNKAIRATIKSRPKVKEWLLKNGCAPAVILYKKMAVWDGITIWSGSEGHRGVLLYKDGVRELKRMLRDGELEGIPKTTVVNSNLWWLCRDDMEWKDNNSDSNVSKFEIKWALGP